MAKKTLTQRHSRARLLGGVGAVVLFGLSAHGVAFAQQATDETDPENTSTLEEVVVTATRVVRDGYQAPTPTSVIGAEQIAAKAPANLADFVNELPSLSGSTSPRANVGSLSAGLIGINALNLRNIGANRTLVLVDGQRIAASTLSGLVDINTIPQSLVKRVDVVTGGASADWGSDAVAGVVNFILDKDFTGLKGTVQSGITTYGDDRTFNATLTGGMRFAEGRGHVLLSGEFANNEGITSIGDRNWFNGAKLFTNPAYTATNGQPQLLALPNSGFATATPGGLITTGPLRGTYFGPGGVPATFNYGPIVSGNFMQGGDWQYADFAKTGDLDPELKRQTVFGRVSYDVTDHFEVFAQASYARAQSTVASLTQFNFGNITIQPDNAFIPLSIAPLVTGPFSLGTFNQDLGPSIATTDRSSTRFVIGASGDFDAAGTNWGWNAYAQRTRNDVYTDALVTVTARYNAAIDAVRSGGSIVCRSTLTNPTNGCVPYDIFGTGVVTDAARNYVLGTTWGKSKLIQDVAAITLHGEPFSTWAGPVSLVTGLEHRREEVSGSNDPLSTTRSFFAGNFRASFGSYTVTEGFAETVIPLAKDMAFAKSLDFNGAVRVTDYSTSGVETTWKLGLGYSPIDDINFRITRSRDIRAPNLAELFQTGITATATLADPFRPPNGSSTAFQVTSGNLNLNPEKADTLGLGVVVRPRFLPGFAGSIDYYDIRIADAITTVNAASVINQCFLGNTAFCSQITRNSSNIITSVSVVPVNVAQQISKGIDFDASYRRPILRGDLTLRFMATQFLKNYTNDGITPATDTVGTNGTNGTLRNSLPKWRYMASVAYEQGPVAVTITGRGLSAGVYNTSYIECTSGCPTSTAANQTINNNRLAGAIYFDTNVTVKLPNDIEAFLAVDNILNTDPVQMAYGPTIGSAPLSVNPLLYDVLGRTFRLGIRFKL